MADYGLISVRLSDGRNLRVRGSVTEMPTNVSVEAIVNHDGSIDRSFTQRAYEFSVSIAERDQSGAIVDLDALMRNPPSDISIQMGASGTIYTYSRAVFIGEPSTDFQTGEVSGLSIKAEGRLVTT